VWLAVVGVISVPVTGFSSSGANHDYGIAAAIVEVLAGACWVGALAATRRRLHRSAQHAGAVLARHRLLARTCWLVATAAGAVMTVVLASPAQLLHTGYGVLVAVKVVPVLLLGVAVFPLAGRAAKRSPAAAARLLRWEYLALLATLALAVAVDRTPPPSINTLNDPFDDLIGYPLSAAPTVLRLFTDWRPGLVLGPLAILLAVGYLAGVRRVAATGSSWQLRRTLSFLGGCLVILLATSSGIGRYTPAMFSVHVVNHMMLAMLAPILLVLGAAALLAEQALRPGHGALPAARSWVRGLVDSPILRLFTHPVVASLLYLGTTYGLYFTPVFDLTQRFHWAHLGIEVAFLAAGYLFSWTLIGPDPLPKTLPALGKLAVLLAVMPIDGLFGILVYKDPVVLGYTYYQSLSVPWITDLLSDQRLGGIVAWILGEGPLLILVIALLIQLGAEDRASASELGAAPEGIDRRSLLDSFTERTAK
ncbi:MAG: cytochrome c oxidase assembly protein, partial [Sciscionella sp.]